MEYQDFKAMCIQSEAELEGNSLDIGATMYPMKVEPEEDIITFMNHEAKGEDFYMEEMPVEAVLNSNCTPLHDGQVFRLMGDTQMNRVRQTGVPLNGDCILTNFVRRYNKRNGQHYPLTDVYECDSCGSKHTDKAALILHIREHFTGLISSLRSKLSKCLSANQSASLLDKKRKALRIRDKIDVTHDLLKIPGYVVGKNVFECHACWKQFKCRSRWVAHVGVCSKKQGFDCDVCGIDFKDKVSLSNHVSVHNGEKCFKCTECGKYFAFWRHLNKHLTVHTDHREFKCDSCGKDFKWKTCLANHIKFHTSAKPHKCTTCGKGFLKKYLLREHINVHTGAKPFECKTCGNRFGSRSNLAQHVATHSSGKDFVCSHCGKGFKMRSYLIVHMNKHADVPKFMCKTCGKQFKFRYSLIRHAKSHGNE